MSERQNIYDDPEFFAGYTRLRQTARGLNDVLEQPALWSVLPRSLDGRSVLDLGCGFGDFARRARRAGAACVVGLDLSLRMLESARHQTNDDAIRYHHMAIEDLDLPEDRPFDLAVSSLAFHYIADYPSALARVAAHLKPGALFAFTVEHPICTALSAQQWIRDDNGHAQYWPVDDYRIEGARETRWFVDGVVKYHRTVETYVNGLLAAGFTLQCLKEPEPVAGAAAEMIPGLDLHRRRPPFLLLSAIRD